MVVEHTQTNVDIEQGKEDWDFYVNVWGDRWLVFVLSISATIFSLVMTLNDSSWYIAAALFFLLSLYLYRRSLYYSQNRTLDIAITIDIEKEKIQIDSTVYSLKKIQEFKQTIAIFYKQYFVSISKSSLSKKERSTLLQVHTEEQNG